MTIPHDTRTNLPMWRTAPGFNSAAAFICTEVGKAFPATLIEDDEDDPQDAPPAHDDDTVQALNGSRTAPFPFTVTPNAQPFVPLVEDPLLPEDQQDYLRWHYKLGHMAFPRLKVLAERGLIPRKLKDCKEPKCPACLYGKQTKRPWRTKAKPSSLSKLATAPGQRVHVDQLKSPTPGLVAQVKGYLTKQRYRVATVFVDEFSDLTYVHVTASDTSEETLEAKEAFECFANSHGVQIMGYHADNGRFADNLFRDAIQASGQSITFCGIGAHHQNGKVERRILNITEHACTMLLHATHRWPRAINAHLWPYALHMAVNLRNNLSREVSGGSPLQRFSSITLKNWQFPKRAYPFVVLSMS